MSQILKTLHCYSLRRTNELKTSRPGTRLQAFLISLNGPIPTKEESCIIRRRYERPQEGGFLRKVLPRHINLQIGDLPKIRTMPSQLHTLSLFGPGNYRLIRIALRRFAKLKGIQRLKLKMTSLDERTISKLHFGGYIRAISIRLTTDFFIALKEPCVLRRLIKLINLHLVVDLSLSRTKLGRINMNKTPKFFEHIAKMTRIQRFDCQLAVSNSRCLNMFFKHIHSCFRRFFCFQVNFEATKSFLALALSFPNIDTLAIISAHQKEFQPKGDKILVLTYANVRLVEDLKFKEFTIPMKGLKSLILSEELKEQEVHFAKDERKISITLH